MRKTVTVLGLGYIGLPTAALLASKGVKVIGVDVNQEVVDTINTGRIHIVEPGLEKLVNGCVKAGTLRAQSGVSQSDVFIITVPTPFEGEDHSPDLSFVKAATSSLAPSLKKGDLILLESTSPVGTTEKLASWIASLRPDLKVPEENDTGADIHIAYCPERVLPGKTLEELVTNERVIGGITTDCSERARELYRIFVTGECTIATSPRVAELAKLAENSFRDVNIAFANELSLVADGLDVDVWELIEVVNKHPRVNVLRPGAGVGGHCIAVDPWFIVSAAPASSNLIRQARVVNDSKPGWVVQRIRQLVEDALIANPDRLESELTIALFGLSFKPDVDDLRESPACQIVAEITSSLGCRCLITEPHLEFADIENQFTGEAMSAKDALSRAEIVVFLVAHSEFKEIDPTLLQSKRVLDVCGLLGSF